MDSWTEYSEENKMYSQTTVHTKVLEAMFPKKEKSKTHKFCSNHIVSARSIFIEWINKWMNEEYMQTCKKMVFHLSHSPQLTHLIWKKKKSHLKGHPCYISEFTQNPQHFCQALFSPWNPFLSVISFSLFVPPLKPWTNLKHQGHFRFMVVTPAT